MSLTTIVEEYVIAALRHAVPETEEDGTVGAWIPEIPGLVAFGADSHECARNLYSLLEEWVRARLAAGDEMPVIEGVDLNREASQSLTSYHGGSGAPNSPRVDFYADEAALEQAFSTHRTTQTTTD